MTEATSRTWHGPRRHGSGLDAQDGVLSILKDLLARSMGPTACVTDVRALRSDRVFRVTYREADRVGTLVAKRLSPERARIERRVLQDWLPASNLIDLGPKLLATCDDEHGRAWHAYQDVGRDTIERLHHEHDSHHGDRGFLHPLEPPVDRAVIEGAVLAAARLHRRFVGQFRAQGRGRSFPSLGEESYLDGVRRSRRALRRAERDGRYFKGNVLERLIDRVERLDRESSVRTRELRVLESPTLLHGDFSIRNTLIFRSSTGPKAVLVDWDHAGVGPCSYDLSIFLSQLPRSDRSHALAAYQDAVDRRLGRGRSISEWNRLFETAELSRLTTTMIMPAEQLLTAQGDWAIGMLEQIDGWYASLQRLVPDHA